MIILGIETSCDETALALIEKTERGFKVLGEALISQTKIHEQYGGVFPMMAKREHSKNLVPLLESLLGQAGMLVSREKISESDTIAPGTILTETLSEAVQNILKDREPELLKNLSIFAQKYTEPQKPAIDLIVVTEGPGLEPALWVGINFAQALGILWDIPVMPANHMEGHIVAGLLDTVRATDEVTPLKALAFPAIALLVSGGHTELILIKEWRDYKLIGRTLDDAAGEAFDKIARILGLPYPGGPEISRLAKEARDTKSSDALPIPKLPRPMLHRDGFDFSFAGLKTAVLYLVKKMGGLETLNHATRAEIAREAEDAITEVLASKTQRALEAHGAQSLIVGGGVIANTHIRKALEAVAHRVGATIYLPEHRLSTDNALMIAIAGAVSYEAQHKAGKKPTLSKQTPIIAQGNLSF